MINLGIEGAKRKVWLSVLLGILCFAFSPFGITTVLGEVQVDIPWSMILPILASMAFGFRYGLIAGLSGGAFFPFLLWANNGWPNLFTSIIYLGIYALLGLLNDKNYFKKIQPFPVRAVIVFGICASVFALYHQILFNPLLAINPPFWVSKTIMNLPTDTLIAFTLKDTINIFLLTLASETLLKLPAVGRLLGLPSEQSSKANNKIFIISITIFLLVWLAFVGLGYSLFNKNIGFEGVHVSLAFLIILSSGFFVSRILFFYNEKQLNAQGDLHHSEEKYRTLVQYSSDPIFSFNPDETYRFVNEAFARAFGKEPKDIIGKSPHAIFPFDEAEKRLILVRKVFQTGKKGEIEVKVNAHAGDVRYFLTLADPIKDESGDVLFVTCISKNITERKLAENAQKETEERYRIFISQVSEGVYRFELDEPMPVEMPLEEQIDFLYNHMRIAECNKAFTEMYGADLQNKIIGKTQKEFHGGTDDPINREAFKQFIKMGYRTENVETKEVDASGQTKYYINNSIGIVENGYLIRTWGTQTDITTQKETEFELIRAKEKAEDLLNKTQKQNSEIELQNERLESLLRISQHKPSSNQDLLDYALGEAISLTDSKIGYIYFYNESSKQFTLNTWSKEVMKECSVLNPQTVYDLDKTGCWGEAVRQRKPIIINNYTDENRYKKGTPHGHVKLLRFLTIPVVIDNTIVAVVGVANKKEDYNQSDIRQLTLLMDTVWRISEREIMIENLKRAKEKAEESDRLKSAFLANMSHEIRTPMNGILGFTELLKEPQLTGEKQQKYIDVIEQSGTRMLNIINDIINISKVESGQMELLISDTNINQQIEFIYTFFKPEVEQKGLQILMKTPLAAKEVTIKTDPEKVYAILTNLVKNAIKFTTQGSIEIGYEKRDRYLEFYVKDTGSGIPQEQRDIIFERFRQGSESLSRTYEGAGLGLSISKAYVEMLGGRIWVSGEPENGSTFYFTLPFNYMEKEERALKNEIPAGIIEKVSKDLKIIVAEDDEPSRLLISKSLKNKEIQCCTLRMALKRLTSVATIPTST